MPNAELTRLMQNARVHLPGALDTAIKLELFNVMDKFFRESSSWRENIEFDVNNQETTYTIVPTLGKIVRLMFVQNKNKNTYAATMEIPGEVVLATAQEPATFTARVVLSVKDPTTRDGDPEFPQQFLDLYLDSLTDGVISNMMMQPGKPYSNQQLSLLRGRNFRNSIAQARVAADHANLHDAQSWRYPRFA